MPSAEATPPGLPQLRPLRGPSGRRDGVEAISGRAALVPGEGGPLYEAALTHRSFAAETPGAIDNERLETLGDAVLGAIVTDLAFRSEADLAEGELTRVRASVVNTEALADLARATGLAERLRLGRGEEASGGRAKASVLAGAFEAVVAARYLSDGYDATRALLQSLFDPLIAAAVEDGARDPKSSLQELAAREGGHLPVYEVSSRGPDHDKQFEASVMVDGAVAGRGRGRSKKQAEQEAARAALDALAASEGSRDARAS